MGRDLLFRAAMNWDLDTVLHVSRPGLPHVHLPRLAQAQRVENSRLLRGGWHWFFIALLSFRMQETEGKQKTKHRPGFKGGTAQLEIPKVEQS